MAVLVRQLEQTPNGCEVLSLARILPELEAREEVAAPALDLAEQSLRRTQRDVDAPLARLNSGRDSAVKAQAYPDAERLRVELTQKQERVDRCRAELERHRRDRHAVEFELRRYATRL